MTHGGEPGAGCSSPPSAIAVFAFAQAVGEDNAFMPKGGRALLLELLGAPAKPAELRSIVQTRRTEPEWRDFVARASRR